MRHPTDQTSSTAQIFAVLGHSPRVGGPSEFDNDNEFPRKDEPVSSLHDDNHANETEGKQEQDQTGDDKDTLGRTLTPRPATEMELAEEMEHLLKAFQLLLNQLLLRHQGVEMDPSITNSLSINLQKLQRSLAMANRLFNNYNGPDRRKINDNLIKASQHQIDAKNLHDELFGPEPEPSSCPSPR